jgi:hypothetical protein
MENNQEFISLYDYLGMPAGNELGKQVNEAAKQNNQPVKFREVSTPNYTGKVMLYKQEFLDNYFNPQSNPTDNTNSDELPF